MGLQLVGCYEAGRAGTELLGLAKVYDQMRQDLTADFRCVFETAAAMLILPYPTLHTY